MTREDYPNFQIYEKIRGEGGAGGVCTMVHESLQAEKIDQETLDPICGKGEELIIVDIFDYNGGDSESGPRDTDVGKTRRMRIFNKYAPPESHTYQGLESQEGVHLFDEVTLIYELSWTPRKKEEEACTVCRCLLCNKYSGVCQL